MIGRLIAVVGPSGVGKDTIMRALADAVPRLGLVRRVITRPPEPEGEDHVSVSGPEFRALADRGGFLLHWEAHGLAYGIPGQVAEDLGRGRVLLVNLSRSVLVRAAEKVEHVARFEVIVLDADPEVLAARLAARGRETTQEISARLSRAAEPLAAGLKITHVDNSGAVPDTVAVIRDRLYPELVMR